MRSKTYGDYHTDTLKAQESYALTLHSMEEYLKAEQIWREILQKTELMEKIAEKKDIFTLRVKLSLGVTLQEQRKI